MLVNKSVHLLPIISPKLLLYRPIKQSFGSSYTLDIVRVAVVEQDAEEGVGADAAVGAGVVDLDGVGARAALEQLRTVAKEARLVVEESYDTPALDSFSNELAPAFARAFPPGF